MEPLPHSKSCYVCGAHNPLGLNLRFETDGKIVRARFVPRPEHNGFKGVVHGGVLATILDEVMVWGCAVQVRRFSYCAEMTVRYLAPSRPGVELIATGWLAENKRNRIYLAEGKLEYADGVSVATSTGKYMPVRDADLEPFFDDFIGSPEQLQRFVPRVP